MQQLQDADMRDPQQADEPVLYLCQLPWLYEKNEAEMIFSS